LGGRTIDCSTGKGGKVKGGKNRDKKIVMVKLIIQEKKTPGTATTERPVCLVKVLELFLWCAILVLVYKQLL
jgi:hypothetical protein